MAVGVAGKAGSRLHLIDPGPVDPQPNADRFFVGTDWVNCVGVRKRDTRRRRFVPRRTNSQHIAIAVRSRYTFSIGTTHFVKLSNVIREAVNRRPFMGRQLFPDPF